MTMMASAPSAEPAVDPSRSVPRPSPVASAGPAGAARQLVLALVAVGIGLRLVQYLANRSLWFDEALLAGNIVGRSFGALLGPLEGSQVAPAGFLLLERAATVLLGGGEYALRLVPLLGGIATVLLAREVGRRLLTPAAAVLGVALVSVSPFLVYFASEVKPYSTDAALTLLVVWLALRVRERPSGRTVATLAAAGAVGVWISQAAVFALAGATLVLAAEAWRGGERGRLRGLVLGTAAWSASFAGSYLVSRGQLSDPEYMNAFWRSGFMPVFPTSPGEWGWLPRALLRTARDPLGVMDRSQSEHGFFQAAATLAALAVGADWMLRRRRHAAALLLAPVGMVLAASALGRYPFGGEYFTGGRVILFLAPLLLLLAAEGAVQLRRRFSLAGWVTIGLLLAPPLVQHALALPMAHSEIRPILAGVRDGWTPETHVYVHHEAAPQFRFYADRFAFRPGEYRIGECWRERPAGYLEEIGRLRGQPRLWVLFANDRVRSPESEPDFILAALDRVGRRLDARFTTGFSAYLYDLRPRADAGEVAIRVPNPEPGLLNRCRGPFARGPAGPAGGETTNPMDGAPAPAINASRRG